MKKWSKQFEREDGDFQYSPFESTVDALIFDYIYNRKNVLTTKEAEGVIKLVKMVLESIYIHFNLESGLIFPSSLNDLRRLCKIFQVAKIEKVAWERRTAGRGKGNLFPTQAVRLPSQVLFQALLNPESSKRIRRIGGKPETAHNVTSSHAITSNPGLRSLCLRLPVSLNQAKFVYLDDFVEFSLGSCVSRMGTVVNIFSSAESSGCYIEALTGESVLEIPVENILSINANLSGRGRTALNRAGLNSEMEVLTVPLMLFSDDMNAGRTKTFSKMDNTLLILPSFLDENGKKSRYHLTSTKSASVQTQLEIIFRDIAKLRRGAVMFDSWRREPILVRGDLLAILADNPRANEICGQAQKKCR